MQKKLLKVSFLMSLTSLLFLLTWCFHVPEKDRIFNKNDSTSEIQYANLNNFYQSINIAEQTIRQMPDKHDNQSEDETILNIEWTENDTQTILDTDSINI